MFTKASLHKDHSLRSNSLQYFFQPIRTLHTHFARVKAEGENDRGHVARMGEAITAPRRAMIAMCVQSMLQEGAC